MSYKIRPMPFVFFRLIFVALLFMVGIICLGTMTLETFTGIRIIDAEPGVDYDAIIATCGVTGFLGMASGSIMLMLMLDRRTIRSDRRQRQHGIDFPDRRTSVDRRLAK